jgi:hypothetical protein
MARIVAQLIAVGAGASANVWGGAHAVLEQTAAGATIEFECAHGSIDVPIHPDEQGRFEAKGTFTPEHGGPLREKDPHGYDARYSGVIAGDEMTLTITRGAETIGVFTFRRGERPPLRKCR